MESTRKRKAAEVVSANSTSKRIKLLNSGNAPPSTPTPADPNVQQIGLKLVGMLRNAADKTGRPISDAFLTLPPRHELPEYYEQIKLPIAIDTIEAKLKRGAYPTVTTVESDVKRMIQNAKDFNMPKSEIYEDAERMRKLAYNFMKVNNPAYRLDPTYSSFATPIPVERATNDDHESASEEPSRRRNSGARGRAPAESKSARRSSEPRANGATNAVNHESDDEAVEGPDLDFEGKSFQEAQQIIISELLSYTDEDGLEIFTPFVNLPSRKLEDYYKIIKHPVSLKSVQKRTRGQHGRTSPTGVTDFKTWDAFEEEVSFIWRNAREYNEDGSDMYDLAGQFEEHFKLRLAEAKEKVGEPASTRIRLSGPKAKASLATPSHHSPSPGPIAIGKSTQPSTGASQRPTGEGGDLDIATSNEAVPNGASSLLPPIKNEKRATQSPVRNATPAASQQTNGIMPPPLSRLASDSPLPPQANGVANGYHFTAPALLPPTAIRPYPLAEVLLPLLTVTFSNRVAPGSPIVLPLEAHPSLATQSTTITVPAKYLNIHIAPTISRELAMGRAYKIFASLNGVPLLNLNTQLQPESGRRTHNFEGNLAPGVNRVEVEIAAAKTSTSNDSAKGLDVEKMTVYANLLK